MVFRGTSAVLPRFFRGAVGTALFVAVAFSVARAAVGPHGDSKCAPVPKIENRAHIYSALASAVLPRWRLLGLDSYEILEVLPVLLL